MTQVQRIQRLQQSVDKLVDKQEKPLWVKVSFITARTGWNNEKMRQARENGLIEWKKTEGGFFYNIKSIDPIFFIK